MKYRLALVFLFFTLCCFAALREKATEISESDKVVLIEALRSKYGDASWSEPQAMLNSENKALCFIPLSSVSTDGTMSTGKATLGPLQEGVYRLYAVWGVSQDEKLAVSAPSEVSREAWLYEVEVKDESIADGKTNTVAAKDHREKRGGWTGTKDVYTRVDRIELKMSSHAEIEAACSKTATSTERPWLAVYAVRTGDLSGDKT